MALKKNQAAPGQFEQTDNVVTATKPAEPAAQAAGQMDAKVAAEVAGTAIAKAAGTSLAAAKGKMVTVLQNLKDALPALDFGVLPRLVGSNGLILDGDKKQLGGRIVLELVSWNDEFVVSPGDDSAEAKEAVRYSRDGVTIEGTGQRVDEYLKYLREVEQYEDANVKQYVQLVGILKEAEKETEHLNGMVQVSLSPQSRKLYEGYRLQESVKIHMGARTEEGIETLVIRTEVKTQGQNTFTLLKVGSK